MRRVAVTMAVTTKSDGQMERMNLAEYEQLLKDAEAKVADAERRAEEAESRSRDREAEAAEAFEAWRKRLVEVAADQVAEEASEWQKVVEEKDAEIARLRAAATEGPPELHTRVAQAEGRASAYERLFFNHVEYIRECARRVPESRTYWDGVGHELRAAGEKTEAALRGEDPPRRATSTSGDATSEDDADGDGVDGAGGSGTKPSGTSTAVQTGSSGGSTPLTSPSKPRGNRGVATEQAAPVLQPEAAKERQRAEDAARARADLESRMASGGDGGNAASTSSWYWPFS